MHRRNLVPNVIERQRGFRETLDNANKVDSIVVTKFGADTRSGFVEREAVDRRNKTDISDGAVYCDWIRFDDDEVVGGTCFLQPFGHGLFTDIGRYRKQRV